MEREVSEKVKQLDQHHSALSAGSRFQTHSSLFKKSCCLRERECCKSLRTLILTAKCIKMTLKILFMHPITLSFLKFFVECAYK